MPETAAAIGLTIAQRLLAVPARKLAERFAFALLDRPPAKGFYLCLTTEGLELRQAAPNAPGPIRVDYLTGAMAHRLRFGGGRSQALARAAGLKPGFNPTVWDATAGMGRDAFVLASLGCRLTLCERSPVMAALLDDGLERAALASDIGPWVRQRLRLVHADATGELRKLAAADRPDVIYLDPMYPAGKDHVLVKKEMQALQQLVGPDRDSDQLLDAALGCAQRRVVVKRPRRAGWLDNRKPASCIESKKTRYDLYVTL